MKVAPDDSVYQVNGVWLGPQGNTFPWVARYLAYAVFLVTFLLILLFKALTPFHVGIPPIWEICFSVLITYALMGFVDHETPVVSVFQTAAAELRAPRKGKRRVIVVRAKWRHGNPFHAPRWSTRMKTFLKAAWRNEELRVHV